MPDDRTFDDPRPPTEEEWGTPLVDPRSAPDIERRFRRRVGVVSGAVPFVAPHPWLYRPFLFLAAPSLTAIDKAFSTSLSFIIARDNSCRFCYSTFRTFLRLSGHSPSDLEELESHFSMQDFGEKEEWGLRLAVRLSRCTNVSGAIERLQSVGVAAPEIREIAGISVFNLAANRIATTLSIPVSQAEEVEGAIQRSWQTAVASLRRWLGGWTQSKAVPDMGAPEGPLASWLRTLRGTPVGTVMQDLTEQWLDASRPLSRQTKLLVLAVVARGTAATQLEEHLRTWLCEHNDLPGEAFADAVDHFGGPAVEDRVEPILQLARASIRYDFGPIKRTAWTCTEGLGRAKTQEVIASISIANALARLEQLFVLDEA
jgi:hypothetical protein